MATYKLIQDIEAEDKLVGPLSFRQFIYALIAAAFFYFTFVIFLHGLYLFTLITLLPGLFTGFLAFPFRKDQPTEVWALAKLRFFIKPHKRIWNQSGMKELVTVTAPKKIEIQRTDGLNQTEVKSRLRALADTLDSRGWAVKNVGLDYYNQPSGSSTSSDRLIDLDSIPREVPSYDVQASDDILDEVTNPVAQHMDQLMNASTNAHRQQIIQELNAPTSAPSPAAAPKTPADFWFMQPATPQPPANQAMFTDTQIVQPTAQDSGNTTPPGITPTDMAALTQAKSSKKARNKSPYHRLKVIQPPDALGNLPPLPPPEKAESNTPNPMLEVSATALPPPPAPVTPSIAIPHAPPVTRTPDPAILSLANNNDLNVATLAREANKATTTRSSTDEVVISLH